MNNVIIGGGGVVGRKLAANPAERGTLGGRDIARLTPAHIAEPITDLPVATIR